MHRNSILSRFVSVTALALALGGCSTLYSRTVDQGDEAAALGRWDDAAMYYERATKLEPDEKEAQNKLHRAHQQQAVARLKVGKAALANGKAREALKPLFDATKFDPANAEATQALADARAAVIAESKKELAAGNLRQALMVVREVLALMPEDSEGLEIEGQARTKLAEQAIGKAQAFEKDSKVAEALLEYAEAQVMRPDNGTALAKVPELKQLLRDRVMFNVALGTFDGDTKADDLGSGIGPADIARGVDTSYLIRVLDKLPGKQAFTLNGMRLGGQFSHYAFRRDTQHSTRSCDYICGTELVTNPEYGRAQADMSAKQMALSSAQSSEQMAAGRVAPAQNAMNAAQQNENVARTARDAANSAVSQCHSMSPQSGACSGVESAAQQAESSYEQAENESQRAQSDYNDAQSQYSQAQSQRSQAQAESDSATAHFRDTPPQITVDKHCNHDYGVDTVTVRGNVDLSLKGESLYDTTPVMNEAVNGHFDATDETFKREPGFCAEVANGKPLSLPREPDVKRKVLESAVHNAQKSIVGAYERYRKDLLTRARAAEGDKKNDDAADAYARFLFTATKMNPDEEAAKKSVSGLVGVTTDAVELAIKR